MLLSFQRNYAGLIIILNTQTHAVDARWKRLSQLSFRYGVFVIIVQICEELNSSDETKTFDFI